MSCHTALSLSGPTACALSVSLLAPPSVTRLQTDMSAKVCLYCFTHLGSIRGWLFHHRPSSPKDVLCLCSTCVSISPLRAVLTSIVSISDPTPSRASAVSLASGFRRTALVPAARDYSIRFPIGPAIPFAISVHSDLTRTAQIVRHFPTSAQHRTHDVRRVVPRYPPAYRAPLPSFLFTPLLWPNLSLLVPRVTMTFRQVSTGSRLRNCCDCCADNIKAFHDRRVFRSNLVRSSPLHIRVAVAVQP